MNINWNQLIKYLSDSKPIMGAFFIVSLAFVIGTKYDISFIPKLADSVYIYAFGIMLFSGSVLLISFSTTLYEKFGNRVSKIKRKRAHKNLTKIEKLIMRQFIHVGSEVLFLHVISEREPGVTRIELSNALTSLESKGLVRVCNDRSACWLKTGCESVVMQLVRSE